LTTGNKPTLISFQNGFNSLDQSRVKEVEIFLVFPISVFCSLLLWPRQKLWQHLLTAQLAYDM